jgi:hypothetical protein
VASPALSQPFGDNSFGNALSTVSTYGYGYDVEHKRKHAIHSGDAFTTDHFVKYGYNDRDEVESAQPFAGIDPDIANPIPLTSGARSYLFDPIGNRLSATEDNVTTLFTPNNLNQHSDVGGVGQTFDEAGNLSSDGTHTYTWDAENRLTVIEPPVPLSPSFGDQKVKYIYDYMGRRVHKQSMEYEIILFGVYAPTEEVRYIYDGWNVIQELKESYFNQWVFTDPVTGQMESYTLAQLDSSVRENPDDYYYVYASEPYNGGYVSVDGDRMSHTVQIGSGGGQPRVHDHSSLRPVQPLCGQPIP